MNDEWNIITFPLFKLHVNKHKNETELYVSEDITIDQRLELESLFNDRLEFTKALLNDIGIDYHLLAKKERHICIIYTANMRSLNLTKISFNFYGYFSDMINSKKHEWIEKYHGVDYKIKISMNKLNNEKLTLEIDFSKSV